MTAVAPRVAAGKHPRVCGHRGSLDTDPENTIRSFRRAIEDGADIVELDLHCSADGALIAMHDATVDRTTDGSGRINDLDLAAIRQLSVAGEPVPIFSEVLEAVDAPIQVEIKDPRAVDPLIALLKTWPEIGQRIVLTGFSDDVLRALAEAVPDVPRGLIIHGFDYRVVGRARALGCAAVYSGKPGLTVEAVREIHEAGMAAVMWLVNTRGQLAKALGLGVDEISTNHPAKVVGWLEPTHHA